MNPTSSLSSAFLRRMARTPLRRRVVMPVRALSTTAPAPAPKGSLKKLNRPSLTQEPYSSTSLAALLARLTLPSTPELQQTVLACLTHPSFSAFQAADPEGTSADGQANNELLAALGNSLLGLFAAEEISIRYPHLPASALQSAVTTFVGPNALADVARELGLRVSAPTLAKPITAHANSPEAIPIRWKRTFMVNMVTREEKKESDIRRRREGFQEGLASVVRAFIGMIYQEQVSRELLPCNVPPY
jgi:large subunit ribosomal protein L44